MSITKIDKILKQEHFNTIIKYVNINCPSIRTPKYSPRYYLSNILTILGDFVTWSSLKNSRICKNKFTFHYKTISRIHRKWSKSGVYEAAYNEIIVKDDELYFTDDETKMIHLFIDSTLIINKTGVEGIGYGGETQKKKFTKITGVCNKNIKNVAIYANKSYSKIIKSKKKKVKEDLNINNIINHLKNQFLIDKKKNKKERDIKLYGKKENIVKDIKIYDKINKENKDVVKFIEVKNINNKNKKDFNKIKTLEHDVKGIKPVLEIIGKKDKKIFLIGDKGYLIKHKDKIDLEEINVKMIAPKKKNQKEKNSTEEKYCLKERYKIENSFAKIKVFNRVHVRRDKLMCTYMGFVYLAFIKISKN